MAIKLSAALREPWRLLAVVLVCLVQSVSARAEDAPEWQRVCEALPDTNCSTWIQFNQSGGVVTEFSKPFAVIAIIEVARDSLEKKLRVFVHFETAPTSQNGAVQVTLDSKPFADISFARCAGPDCVGEAQISAADVAIFERAQSFDIQAPNFKASSPVRNFTATRAGRGKTIAEVNAENAERQRLLQEELMKKAEEANQRLKKSSEVSFLSEAPAARMHEGFCPALEQVMAAAAAPDGWKSIEGEKSGAFISARISLPDSGECVIDRPYSYICTTRFKLRDVADKQVASLAQAIGKCLPDRMEERETSNDGLPTVSFNNKNGKRSKVDVWITLDKTSGGGGFDVGLWVDRN